MTDRCGHAGLHNVERRVCTTRSLIGQRHPPARAICRQQTDSAGRHVWRRLRASVRTQSVGAVCRRADEGPKAPRTSARGPRRALHSALECGELGGQFDVIPGELTQTYKRADDKDAHLHRAGTVQNHAAIRRRAL